MDKFKSSAHFIAAKNISELFSCDYVIQYFCKTTLKHNAITESEKIIISGTGYTGEKGVELIIPNEIASGIWNNLLNEIYKIPDH